MQDPMLLQSLTSHALEVNCITKLTIGLQILRVILDTSYVFFKTEFQAGQRDWLQSITKGL